MIDSNNQLKKLSADLVAAARSIMEKKTTKLDPVGKADADIDNDGDVDASDKYLHNRRKAIAKNMKKEEVEQIDELSTDTMQSYRAKAKADPAFEKRKGKISAARKAVMAKRNKGIETASKKISDAHKKEYNEHKDVQNAISDHLKSEGAHKVLTKHGFKKAVENEKRAVYTKPDSDAGVVHTVTVHKTDKGHSPHHISSYSSTSGWQSSDDRHYSDRHWPKDYYKKADVEHHKAKAESEYADHIKGQMAYHHKKGLEEAVKVLGDEMINEALDAAARYGDHHTAIKSLLKSISQHVESHKSDALKHKDYRGKKGVHWGHVGDLAQVHSQLADIHDRLAQQGEYKKSMSESVEDLDIEQIDELSKATMGAYVKKAADDFQKRKPKMGYDGQLKKMQNRKVGVNRALDKMYGEEVELDEAPVDGVAAGSMNNDGHLCATKVFHKEWAEGTPIFSQHAEPDADGHIAWYDVMFEHGIEKRVMIEDLEVLMAETHERHGKRKMKEEAELDEARGRPRKNPLPAGQDSEEPEPRQHIIQQLQRAKLSMHGSAPIKFKDGTTHEVHGKHAAHLLGKYSDMKPYEKEAFQKKIGQSHANLKSEL